MRSAVMPWVVAIIERGQQRVVFGDVVRVAAEFLGELEDEFSVRDHGSPRRRQPGRDCRARRRRYWRCGFRQAALLDALRKKGARCRAEKFSARMRPRPQLSCEVEAASAGLGSRRAPARRRRSARCSTGCACRFRSGTSGRYPRAAFPESRAGARSCRRHRIFRRAPRPAPRRCVSSRSDRNGRADSREFRRWRARARHSNRPDLFPRRRDRLQRSNAARARLLNFLQRSRPTP